MNRHSPHVGGEPRPGHHHDPNSVMHSQCILQPSQSNRYLWNCLFHTTDIFSRMAATARLRLLIGFRLKEQNLVVEEKTRSWSSCTEHSSETVVKMRLHCVISVLADSCLTSSHHFSPEAQYSECSAIQYRVRYLRYCCIRDEYIQLILQHISVLL